MFKNLKHRVEGEKTILTGAHRCSFPSLFEKKGNPNYPDAAEKYEITLLVDKQDPMLKDLRRLMDKAMNEKYGNKSRWPDMYYNPVRDGDKSDLEKYPEQAGHYVIKLSDANNQPLVVGRDKKEIFDAKEIYPGCYVQCRFDVYTWKKSHGIGLSLRVVRKIADAEPFGTARGVENVDDLPDLEPLATEDTNAGDDPFAGFGE